MEKQKNKPYFEELDKDRPSQTFGDFLANIGEKCKLSEPEALQKVWNTYAIIGLNEGDGNSRGLVTIEGTTSPFIIATLCKQLIEAFKVASFKIKDGAHNQVGRYLKCIEYIEALVGYLKTDFVEDVVGEENVDFINAIMKEAKKESNEKVKNGLEEVLERISKKNSNSEEEVK